MSHADPLNPSTWPTEPPKDDGYYFISRRPPAGCSWPSEPVRLIHYDGKQPAEYAPIGLPWRRADDKEDDLRWLPIPLTPAALAAPAAKEAGSVVGSALDQWDQIPNDIKSDLPPAFVGAMDALRQAADAGLLSPSPAPPAEVEALAATLAEEFQALIIAGMATDISDDEVAGKMAARLRGLLRCHAAPAAEMRKLLEEAADEIEHGRCGTKWIRHLADLERPSGPSPARVAHRQRLDAAVDDLLARLRASAGGK